jgi:hypothetical protein
MNRKQREFSPLKRGATAYANILSKQRKSKVRKQGISLPET